SVGLSSTRPLQSSSMLLHSSGVGVPATALHVGTPPAAQIITPERRQAPTPTEHDWPTSTGLSSIVPLQLSSRLLHSTPVGRHGGVSPRTIMAMSSKSLSPPRNRSSKPK